MREGEGNGERARKRQMELTLSRSLLISLFLYVPITSSFVRPFLSHPDRSPFYNQLKINIEFLMRPSEKRE